MSTPETVNTIRQHPRGRIAVCPFHEGDTGTLYIFRAAKRDWFKCLGCGEEGYATLTGGKYRLRCATFPNIKSGKAFRLACPD